MISIEAHLLFLETFRRFRKDTRGTTGLLFAMAALPMLLCIGAAIDVARMYSNREKLLGVLDIALQQATGGDPSMSAEDRKRAAESAFETFAPVSGVEGSVADFSVVMDTQPDRIVGVVNAQVSMKLYFGELFHMPTVTISAKAETTKDLAAIRNRRIACHGGGTAESYQRLGCAYL